MCGAFVLHMAVASGQAGQLLAHATTFSQIPLVHAYFINYIESKIAAPQGNAVSGFVPFTAISVHSLTIPSLGVMKPKT